MRAADADGQAARHVTGVLTADSQGVVTWAK